MTVLDRSDLEASPLADLHMIADQIGLESFRRLRKADLIDAILAAQTGEGGADTGNPSREETVSGTRARRSSRGRSRRASAGEQEEAAESEEELAGEGADERPARGRRGRTAGRAGQAAERGAGRTAEQGTGRGAGRTAERAAGRTAERSQREPATELTDMAERTAEGVVEVLGNGSAFLRVSPPEASEEDVYISAAQVRRCELVSGDRVSGPVRNPRRSERYSSLIRVQTINGVAADAVTEGARFQDLPVVWPSERIAFNSEDPTLKAIEWLTPLGRGSRALIVGAARAGKTETLRRIADALSEMEGMETMLVLAGARPEEIQDAKAGQLPPLAAVDFAASADVQGQAVESVIEAARRLVVRGSHVVVLIDGLDGLHPHTARKVLAAARRVADGGSLTVIATASRPFGGETTVIALDAARASTGRLPAIDLLASGTLRAELLVGEDGAQEITRARAAAADAL